MKHTTNGDKCCNVRNADSSLEDTLTRSRKETVLKQNNSVLRLRHLFSSVTFVKGRRKTLGADETQITRTLRR